MNRINFLVFDTRSGSTFLASLLETFPELGVTLESPLPFLLLTGKSMYASDRDIDLLIENLYGKKRKLYADKKFCEWGIDEEVLREEMVARLPISNSDVLLLILDIYFKQTKPTAQYYIYKGVDFNLLRKARNAFPGSRCIYIFRDGRAVFASKKKAINLNTGDRMATDPISEAKRWVGNFHLVETAFDKKNLFFVRYERLVERKDEVLSSIRRFIAGDISKSNNASENLGGDYLQRIPVSQKDLHPNVGKGPIASRISAWESELPFSEQFFYEKTSHKELQMRGYQLNCYGKTLSNAQRVSTIKYWFALALIRLRYLSKRLKLYSRNPVLLIKKISLRMDL